MQHLFIVDPLERLHPDKDSSIAFMREAARRGQAVWAACADTLRVDQGGRPAARVVAVQPRDGADWYRLGAQREALCDEFDAVWMRTDPPVDRAFTRAVQILALVAPPTQVVNDPRGLLQIDEKLFALRFPSLTPETYVSARIEDLMQFLERLGGEMVIKPIGGCGGQGVLHLRRSDPNLSSLLELATDDGRTHQIAQRYLPAVREGDKRILLVEGEPVGAVMRVPLDRETRANFHAGGAPRAAEIRDRDREICAALAPELRALGVVFAGIDVIGDWLTEVNVTSPTGVREVAQLTGEHLERAVLDAVERRVKSAAAPASP